MVKSVPLDAQPQNEILRSWGLGDALNKQRRKPNGYPGALLASIIPNSVNQILRSLMLQIKAVEYTPVE